MKILFTLGILFFWAMLMQANLMGAAHGSKKTAGLDADVAKSAWHRTLALTIAWALLVTAAGVWGLIRIWR